MNGTNCDKVTKEKMLLQKLKRWGNILDKEVWKLLSGKVALKQNEDPGEDSGNPWSRNS